MVAGMVPLTFLKYFEIGGPQLTMHVSSHVCEEELTGDKGYTKFQTRQALLSYGWLFISIRSMCMCINTIDFPIMSTTGYKSISPFGNDEHNQFYPIVHP